MSAAQFRYIVRTADHFVSDVRDSAVRAGTRALALAAERGMSYEIIRAYADGADAELPYAGGSETRLGQAHPNGRIDWFMPPESA